LNQRFGVHQVIAGRHNDRSDLHRGKGILLTEIDGFLFADFFAQAALAFFEKCAGVAVDDWFLRNGLWERNINGLSFHQTFIPFRHALAGTLFRAGQTGIALRVIDVTRFLFDGDIKVATNP